MSWSMVKSASWGAATLMGAALLAGPALADGMPSRGKIASAPESRLCSTSGSVAYTTDYVFRGISQTNDRQGAVQGGLELSCGKFYLGVAGSSIGFENGSEVDIYGGYKTTIGRFAIDLGFIYYAYPGAFDNTVDFFEVKAGASTEVWKGGTVGATVFYTPEYTYEWGAVATYEVGLTQALPKVGMFSPTFSATYGYSDFLDFGFASYSYWNAGVSLGFLEKWSLDLRYHDSDSDSAFAAGPIADERFVATLKYSF